jgi:hypothetical protein
MGLITTIVIKQKHALYSYISVPVESKGDKAPKGCAAAVLTSSSSNQQHKQGTDSNKSKEKYRLQAVSVTFHSYSNSGTARQLSPR